MIAKGWIAFLVVAALVVWFRDVVDAVAQGDWSSIQRDMKRDILIWLGCGSFLTLVFFGVPWLFVRLGLIKLPPEA